MKSTKAAWQFAARCAGVGILGCVGLMLMGCAGEDEADEDDEEPVMTAAKLLIEHNATAEDTGFQGFADGDPWDELEIAGPSGRIVLARAQGALAGFGLTELFFETSEPPNADVPIADVLARLPEGTYEFKGKMVDGAESSLMATLTHTIPAGPVLVVPAEGAADVNPNDTVVSWEAVTETYDGSPDLHVVGYQVIVEQTQEPLLFPKGFAKPVFSVYLPASATSVTVPKEFMVANALYDWEVLAIEESGNQTLSSSDFMTGSGTDAPEVPHEFELTRAKLLIEHNATDRDTGFQGFADGDPWDQLLIDPGAPLVVVDTAGGLAGFGLTELFFETSEPENDEVPISDVLSRIPQGAYPFVGDMVGGSPSTLPASMSHTIPAGPVLVSPAAGALDVDPQHTVVTWQPVSQSLDGSPDVEIVGYQVIVEKDAEPVYTQGFAKPVFSVYLPASATTLTVPAEFMESGAPYKFEVLAIEEGGAQTLSSGAFTTR